MISASENDSLSGIPFVNIFTVLEACIVPLTVGQSLDMFFTNHHFRRVRGLAGYTLCVKCQDCYALCF